ncbi:MAG: acylneuraminate cytidylyltransferase family protein [Crocinitomicaceae bacterium]|nr:acylneuraminate cytidylyltransferase family protein [Crocinitomicaceae bacterium]
MIKKGFHITALLPMKGHSERVPAKNLRLFNGKPLFYHVLETLDKSEYINKIIVNTDSEEIASKARSVSDKVIIHDRPEAIRGDMVSINEIINHDVLLSGDQYFLQTHSTNPLLTVRTINKAIEKFKEEMDVIDSLFSVTRLQTRLYWKDGKPVNHNPLELLRTQDLPPVYEENSNFYIFTRDSFINSGKKRIGLKPLMFEVDKLEAQDIDEPADFLLAEALQKLNLVK